MFARRQGVILSAILAITGSEEAAARFGNPADPPTNYCAPLVDLRRLTVAQADNVKYLCKSVSMDEAMFLAENYDDAEFRRLDAKVQSLKAAIRRSKTYSELMRNAIAYRDFMRTITGD